MLLLVIALLAVGLWLTGFVVFLFGMSHARRGHEEAAGFFFEDQHPEPESDYEPELIPVRVRVHHPRRRSHHGPLRHALHGH